MNTSNHDALRAELPRDGADTAPPGFRRSAPDGIRFGGEGRDGGGGG